MTAFASLRRVLSADERARARREFDRGVPEYREDDPEGSFERALGRLAEARAQGDKVLNGYGALVDRLRLAELVVYRAKLLADDMESIIERYKTTHMRGAAPTAEGIANMARRFVRDYVEVIEPTLRDALGIGPDEVFSFREEEDARAKLLGSRRAEDRLRREGRWTP